MHSLTTKSQVTTSHREILLPGGSEPRAEELTEMFTREGCMVTAARDGIEGLYQLTDSKPALIISDVWMPKMAGYDFHHTVKRDGIVFPSNVGWWDYPAPDCVLCSPWEEKMFNSRTLDVKHFYTRYLGYCFCGHGRAALGRTCNLRCKKRSPRQTRRNGNELMRNALNLKVPDVYNKLSLSTGVASYDPRNSTIRDLLDRRTSRFEDECIAMGLVKIVDR